MKILYCSRFFNTQQFHRPNDIIKINLVLWNPLKIYLLHQRNGVGKNSDTISSAKDVLISLIGG